MLVRLFMVPLTVPLSAVTLFMIARRLVFLLKLLSEMLYFSKELVREECVCDYIYI